MAYDVYSEFDIEQHKKTYINYLEVLIDTDGKVLYAVPSHQLRLEKLAAEKQDCSVEEIRERCPKNMYFDYITWLIEQTDAVVVWTNCIQYGRIVTDKQRGALRRLKLSGVYKGPLISKKYEELGRRSRDEVI